jgi:hypothetical protein
MNITKKMTILLLLSLTSFSFATSKTIIFQQGLDGYNGCSDNELRSHAQNYEDGPVDSVMEISEL